MSSSSSTPLTDNGYNLLGTALQGTTSGTGDRFSDTPLLGTLANNGGTTETLAPQAGSPAIGHGDPGQAGTTAQNGVVRPAGAVDIGAFQTAVNPLVVTTTADSGTGSLAGGHHLRG